MVLLVSACGGAPSKEVANELADDASTQLVTEVQRLIDEPVDSQDRLTSQHDVAQWLADPSDSTYYAQHSRFSHRLLSSKDADGTSEYDLAVYSRAEDTSFNNGATWGRVCMVLVVSFGENPVVSQKPLVCPDGTPSEGNSYY